MLDVIPSGGHGDGSESARVRHLNGGVFLEHHSVGSERVTGKNTP